MHTWFIIRIELLDTQDSFSVRASWKASIVALIQLYPVDSPLYLILSPTRIFSCIRSSKEGENLGTTAQWPQIAQWRLSMMHSVILVRMLARYLRMHTPSLEPRCEGEGERAPDTHCMRMRLINPWKHMVAAAKRHHVKGCGHMMSKAQTVCVHAAIACKSEAEAVSEATWSRRRTVDFVF